MIRNLYSVRDAKASVFCPPFVSHNDNTAKRDFWHAGQDKTTQLGQHPEDFSLWLVGQIDDDKGTLLPCVPEQIASPTAHFTED